MFGLGADTVGVGDTRRWRGRRGSADVGGSAGCWVFGKIATAPNRIGPWGIGQVAADMIKLLLKDDWGTTLCRSHGVYFLRRRRLWSP